MIFDFRLQVFNAVARRLSYTRAAEELYITQPAVTKHIKTLEEYYKTRLFERRGNSIILTDAGKTLYKYTTRMAQLQEELEQNMGTADNEWKGTLHVGASTTIMQYVLPKIIAAFKIAYPDVVLKIDSGNTEHVEAALLNGSIDIGFIEGFTRNRLIKYIPFANDELVLTGRKANPALNRKTTTIADLYKMSWVMREPGSGTLEVIMQALKKAKVSSKDLMIDIQLDSTEAIKSYILHSDSVSFISRYAITQHEEGLYNIAGVKGINITRPLYAIHPHGQPSRLVALFLKFAKSHN
ncbi:MAG: hypothetical protein BGO70_03795 [Bacteroidetes bacterium 43-93]|nr:LysR family transcriptional regulator [Bacteroidota bacterium]OJW98859.1 MAG: hypothetical protein BGO70_03795 [Bacteroidetes bacterium 43-93]